MPAASFAEVATKMRCTLTHRHYSRTVFVSFIYLLTEMLLSGRDVSQSLRDYLYRTNIVAEQAEDGKNKPSGFRLIAEILINI